MSPGAFDAMRLERAPHEPAGFGHDFRQLCKSSTAPYHRERLSHRHLLNVHLVIHAVGS
jgi:hypothetical protein